MATAGPAPWRHEDFWKFREGFRRTNKGTMRKQGYEWSLLSGYRPKETEGLKPTKPKSKEIVLHNGWKVKVPDADYEDFIGHHASPTSDPDTVIGQYLENAWEGNKVSVDGVGHIDEIVYSPRYQLLWVWFADYTDGSIVVYFRVPKEVFFELRHLAESGGTTISSVDGKQRHVLGIRFWDIIRIRGQQKGSRYKYEYTYKGEHEPIERQSTRAITAVEQQLSTNLDKVTESGEQEFKEYLDMFKRRLTDSAKIVYNNLGTNRERYSFLKKHNVDLPSYEELADTNF